MGVTIMFFWGWGICVWDHCSLVGLKVARWVRAMGRVEPCELLRLQELG